MLQGIDHLVVVTRDLDTAIAGYRALGFTVTPGGRHARASHNALVAFADGAYLELIAYWEDGSAHRWWPPLQKGGGLVDFCLATDDLDADLAAFRRAGVTMEDRSPGGRARPDGYQLRWSSAVPARAQQGVAPFIIEDDTPRAERVPHEITHANGVTGVGVVTVAVDDVPRVAGWYAGVLGRPGEPVKRDDLGAAGYRFRVGPHALEFLAPVVAGAGPLAEWLTRRGPSPCAATLLGGAPKGPVDPARAQAARFIFV